MSRRQNFEFQPERWRVSNRRKSLIEVSDDQADDFRNGSSERFAAHKIKNPVKQAVEEELQAAKAKGDTERVEFLKQVKNDFNFPPETPLN